MLVLANIRTVEGKVSLAFTSRKKEWWGVSNYFDNRERKKECCGWVVSIIIILKTDGKLNKVKLVINGELISINIYKLTGCWSWWYYHVD